MGFDFADFPKQFILTRTDPPGIAGAERDVFGDWRIHAAPGRSARPDRGGGRDARRDF